MLMEICHRNPLEVYPEDLQYNCFFGRTAHQDLLNEQSGVVVNDMFVVVSRLIRQLIPTLQVVEILNLTQLKESGQWAAGLLSYGCSKLPIVDVVGVLVLRFHVSHMTHGNAMSLKFPPGEQVSSK